MLLCAIKGFGAWVALEDFRRVECADKIFPRDPLEW